MGLLKAILNLWMCLGLEIAALLKRTEKEVNWNILNGWQLITENEKGNNVGALEALFQSRRDREVS